MGICQQLFKISIEHDFFADFVCKPLVFVPVDETSIVLKNAGLLLKSTNCGLAAFFDVEQKHIL